MTVRAALAIHACLAVGAATVVLADARVHTELTEVRACRPLPGGGALVGTGGGLVRVDEGGQARAVWTAADGLPGTRIDSISAVGDELWVGTESGAAAISLERGKLAISKTAGTRSVRDVIAFDGAVYAATWEGGVVKLGGRAAALAWKGGNNPKARARVAALAVADGALWAGTANGLYRLAGGTLELTSIEAGANEVQALYGEGANLWIGTSAGLYVRDAAGVQGLGGGDIRAVGKLDGAIVAAGFGGGLARVDRGRLVPLAGAPAGLVMAQALAEVAAQGGAACAGGLEGLWLRARTGAAWAPARAARGIPANDLSALAVDGERLWVGTFDHGLAKLERGTWTRIEDRALDHRINALLVEPRAGKPSRLWVATAAGLSVIDGGTISQLTKREGLPARSVLALGRLRDGRILVGTTSGAAIVGDGRPVALGGKQGIEAKNVWAVAEDADGWIWLGTTTGLYRGKPDDTAWTRYSVATGHLRDDWVMALATRDHAIWVGTYKGGVTRFDPTSDAAGVTATPLGDGWINPGGLRLSGATLYASTMEGVRTSDGVSPSWTPLAAKLPGKDTTATAELGGTLYVATRRGLWARSAGAE